MLISHGRANVFLRTVAVMRTQFLWWTCKNSGVSGPVVAAGDCVAKHTEHLVRHAIRRRESRNALYPPTPSAPAQCSLWSLHSANSRASQLNSRGKLVWRWLRDHPPSEKLIDQMWMRGWVDSLNANMWFGHFEMCKQLEILWMWRHRMQSFCSRDDARNGRFPAHCALHTGHTGHQSYQ